MDVGTGVVLLAEAEAHCGVRVLVFGRRQLADRSVPVVRGVVPARVRHHRSLRWCRLVQRRSQEFQVAGGRGVSATGI